MPLGELLIIEVSLVGQLERQEARARKRKSPLGLGSRDLTFERILRPRPASHEDKLVIAFRHGNPTPAAYNGLTTKFTKDTKK
jgi:hypothetical protein